MLIAKKLRYEVAYFHWQCTVGQCRRKFIGMMDLFEHLAEAHGETLIYLSADRLDKGIKRLSILPRDYPDEKRNVTPFRQKSKA